MWRNVVRDAENDEEIFEYATERECRTGFYRLLVAYTVACRADHVWRQITSDTGRAAVVGRRFVAQHPEFTEEYKDRIYYELDDTEVDVKADLFLGVVQKRATPESTATQA